MNKFDSLGDRMKGYEAVSKNFLMRRQPVIIRLDMKAGHTFTKKFDKPFDDIFMKSMQDTMLYLCENVQNCVLGYCQSDEISLVLCDYNKLTTQGWFDNNVQKIVSISSAMATLSFNQNYIKNVKVWNSERYEDMDATCLKLSELKYQNYMHQFFRALFDSRAFNLSKEEVNNYFIWRQQDATRNSIQATAQAFYSHKEIEGINTKKLQDKLFTEKGINWNDLPITKKRGSCCIKRVIQNPNVDIKDGAYPRKKWFIDNDIPIFSQNRNYVDDRIWFEC